MRNNKALSTALYNNFLKESTGVGDMAQWGQLIMPLIEKIYPDTLVSQIADMQPMSSPVGKIAAVYAIYTGDSGSLDNNTFFVNSAIIAVPGAPAVSANSSYALGGQTVVVRHSEVLNYSSWSSSALVNAPATATMMLVSNITTDPISAVAGTNFDGTPIIYITDNRTAIKKIFRKYSSSTDPVSFAEENNRPNQINFETRTVTMEAKTRKIKSQMPVERLQDLKSVYGEEYTDIISQSVASSIRQEIDKEVINYLKNAATPMWMSTLSLGGTGGAYGGKSIGMQSGVFDISNDIVLNINLAAESIVRATKRNRTMFVLADPTTISYLQINPWRVVADPDKDNPFYVGKIGAYPLFCDLYADSHYVMVGYRYDSDASGDAGLIYAPYTHNFLAADGYDPMFHTHMMTINRYAYTLHPQDTGTGNSDSDFFRIFYMDYNNISNLSENVIRPF